MLTDATISALRRKCDIPEMVDEKGLYLLVTPIGSRFWRFRYRSPIGAPGNKKIRFRADIIPKCLWRKRANGVMPRDRTWLMGSIRACGEPVRESVLAIPLKRLRGNSSVSCGRQTSVPRVLRGLKRI
jgi:hypothetical protein